MKESLMTLKNIKFLAFSVLDIILLYCITKMIYLRIIVIKNHWLYVIWFMIPHNSIDINAPLIFDFKKTKV